VRGLTERGGLDIVFKISEEFGRLPREMELVVFRLVQECLTNIHRHSGSRNATIQVLRDRERVIVEIQDSGRGIAREKLAEIQSKGSGVGIRGMQERLRQFGGGDEDRLGEHRHDSIGNDPAGEIGADDGAPRGRRVKSRAAGEGTIKWRGLLVAGRRCGGSDNSNSTQEFRTAISVYYALLKTIRFVEVHLLFSTGRGQM